MRVGIIGTGSMGTILIEAFIRSEALRPDQIVVSNRTPEKAAALACRHPGMKVAARNADLAEGSDIIFICVKPLEYRQVLQDLAEALTARHLLVTITSPLRLADLEEQAACPVVRVVPSITNAAMSGLTLVEFGSRTSAEHRQTILPLLSRISHPVEIPEKFLRIASDLSSCGPAFLSYILQEMIRSAAEETGLAEETARFLVTQMVIGFGELLKRNVFSLDSLKERVCVPGGITGEGLQVLEQSIPGVFHKVFQRTHEKFAEDLTAVQRNLES